MDNLRDLRYTLRVNKLLFHKYRYVADYDGRSANRDIELFIKRRVRDFEERHGVIDMDDLK